MWNDHTTLNFNHTNKRCYHTIGVNIIYFNDFFLSHHLMFDHINLNMICVHHVWSNFKSLITPSEFWSHHRHFVHTIRCNSHYTLFVTPTRYVHTVCVWSYQNSMIYTIESKSHQIVLFTRVTCFTPRLYNHTEVVRVHTRNEFIHTEIEQTILYSIHITLHQMISYSKLSEDCLRSPKLRSTDSVNPRSVLSRVRPRYRHLL